MLCLDTHSLIEIAKGNTKFAGLITKDFIITDLTLAEFYGIMLNQDESTANYWYKKLSAYSRPADKLILAKSIKFKRKNKNIQLADCVSYVYAAENNHRLITGNKAFERMPHVELIK